MKIRSFSFSYDVGKAYAERGIANDNPKASMQELAVKTLDMYHDSGLYTAIINKDGSVSITRTKISDEQYNKALETINKLNNNGYKQQEQQQKDKAKQEEEQNRENCRL